MPHRFQTVNTGTIVADSCRIPDPVIRPLSSDRWPVVVGQNSRLRDLALSVGLHVTATVAATGVFMALTDALGWRRLDLLQDVQTLVRLLI